MLTAEDLRLIQKIHLQLGKRVDSPFSGEYRSAFRGQGMEFEDVRPYIPGDDVRRIDWNVTARTGVTHVKEFREEREMNLMIVADVSASMRFGSRERDKKKTRVDYATKNTLLSSCIIPFHSHQLHLIHAFRHRRFNLFRHRPPPVLHRLPLRVLFFCAVHGNLSLFFVCFVLTTSSSKVCFFLCVFFVCSSVSTKFSPSFIYLILFSSLSCLAAKHKRTTTQNNNNKTTTKKEHQLSLSPVSPCSSSHTFLCLGRRHERERERETRWVMTTTPPGRTTLVGASPNTARPKADRLR